VVLVERVLPGRTTRGCKTLQQDSCRLKPSTGAATGAVQKHHYLHALDYSAACYCIMHAAPGKAAQLRARSGKRMLPACTQVVLAGSPTRTVNC